MAIIRIPRFTRLKGVRPAVAIPEDPLSAFTAEVDLKTPRRRWRR